MRIAIMLLALVSAKDSYLPLGDAATLLLPSESEIVASALQLCSRER